MSKPHSRPDALQLLKKPAKIPLGAHQPLTCASFSPFSPPPDCPQSPPIASKRKLRKVHTDSYRFGRRCKRASAIVGAGVGCRSHKGLTRCIKVQLVCSLVCSFASSLCYMLHARRWLSPPIIHHPSTHYPLLRTHCPLSIKPNPSRSSLALPAAIACISASHCSLSASARPFSPIDWTLTPGRTESPSTAFEPLPTSRPSQLFFLSFSLTRGKKEKRVQQKGNSQLKKKGLFLSLSFSLITSYQ